MLIATYQEPQQTIAKERIEKDHGNSKPLVQVLFRLEEWFLARDTKMMEFSFGFVANFGVSFWVGWPGFHAYSVKSQGDSALYKSLMVLFFSDWRWVSAIFCFVAFLHLNSLVCSFLKQEESQRIGFWSIFGTTASRSNCCLISASIWFNIFRVYYLDQVPGPGFSLIFGVVLAFVWSFLCLTVGVKSASRRHLNAMSRKIEEVKRRIN
jgi:hypothetical protein